MSAPETQEELTRLLIAWSNGEQEALDRLMPVVYGELKRLARRYMSQESPSPTLQTTALVNEAYLRLIEQKNAGWQNRAHFFAISAQLMRRILVSMARARHAQRRGGDAKAVEFDEALALTRTNSGSVLAIDEALTTLAALNERQSQVVEMRFFAGLSVEETAEVLKVSPDTVMRDWKRAKAWLYCELSGGGGNAAHA